MEERIASGGVIKRSHIFDKIISLENLFLAWREFKRGKLKKPGVQEFNFNLENNLFVKSERSIIFRSAETLQGV